MTNLKTDFENHPHNFDLSQDDDGTRHAVSPLLSLTVLPDGETKLFQRRAIKRVGSGNPEFATCLVAVLDGVRCYVHGNQIVLTRQELQL